MAKRYGLIVELNEHELIIRFLQEVHTDGKAFD